MRVLITGNMGYVGPVLVRHLRRRFPAAELIGYDSGLFAHCLTGCTDLPEALLDRQVFGDVRDLPADLLAGVDAVVHLAAISNDPMGNRFADATDAVNHQASTRLAALARDAGVRHFVFASSCSVYGAAGAAARRETDPTNPLTAYAKSKIATEQGLAAMGQGGMLVTCLRFATACGMSDRLRLDLVLNDFVACAIAARRITILSDGTPWRPLIEVRDMARAIEWGITRAASDGGTLLVVNVGSDRWNFQVRELAAAVVRCVPESWMTVNADAAPDLRSYRVDFSLFARLAPAYQPQVSLNDAIAGLQDGLRRMEFNDPEFRNGKFMRLRVLTQHIEAGRLSPEVRRQ